MREMVLGDIYPMGHEHIEHPLVKQGWFAWLNVYRWSYYPKTGVPAR
jgi:hypothetical protein